MKRFFGSKAVFFTLVSLSIWLVGCQFSCSLAMSENERFIQGTWHRGGVLEDDDDSFSWYMDLTFERGRYVQKGYPPYYGEGKYTVIRSEENQIVLHLMGQTGNEKGVDREMTITINQPKDSLIVSGEAMTRKK